MITRDISLEDCIFDLIDNSIDGAWELSGGHPLTLNDETDLSPYRISICLDENKFSISDNCGGITLDDAVDYAFTFGRKEGAETEDYSIGVYGIGMKRAVFKLGSSIEIKSTYQVDSAIESFRVPIDVDAWLESGDSVWDFDIEESEALEQPGVEISVKDLTEVAKRSFDNPRFVRNIRRAIARDYALHLKRGLTIEIGDSLVKGWAIELLKGGEFSPLRAQFEEVIDGEEIFVEVLAGMGAPPPDDSEPSEDIDLEENRSGWYVVCNGRIVLAADKTSVTGWGTPGWPRWHPQYSGFMGVIIFSSRRADLLPLTTTKRSVDETSAIYRQFRSVMHEATKEWIAYTNARKQARDQAITKEKVAKAIPIAEVPFLKQVELPKFQPEPKEPEANVHYSVPRKRLRSLAAAFGNINLSHKDVGLTSFEYAFEDFVGEE